jgi:hypothetical protein
MFRLVFRGCAGIVPAGVLELNAKTAKGETQQKILA